MKLVYLIMAHNQPNHLFRLIQSLNSDQVAFYIHIDKKSILSQFTSFPYSRNVTFINNRVSVNHCGYSTAKAMINLLEASAEKGDYDYFQFLSGWDYPIKNNHYIYTFLNQHYPMNFLNFYPLASNVVFIDAIQKYFLIDLIGSLPKILQKPMKIIQYLALKLPFHRKFFAGITPYRGSAWFCLNRDTVQYILDFLNSPNGTDIINYFKNVFSPDEILFHTIVLNSPYARMCRYYQRDIQNSNVPLKNENEAYLHYIDWNPNREDPAVLDINDFAILKNSDALYARKFGEKKSLLLLTRIDYELLKQSDEMAE